MATYISVTTDAFAEARKSVQTRQVQNNIRRPLRGIQVKPDTYAVIRVRTAAGEDIPLFDSSSDIVQNGIGTSPLYANYLIQSIQEMRAEKQQIIETFGEDYVFFFGERPRFLDVRGVLLNTQDFNWKSEFWANYEQNLRGTKLVEKNARLYFYFDDIVVEGYMLSAAGNLDSSTPNMMPFQFQIFITNYAILSTVGSVFIPTSDTGTAPPEGLEPFSIDNRRANAAALGLSGASGGLTGFLAKTAQLATDASFSIQSTLENLKNALYGRPLVVPDGLGSQVVVPPISNKGEFGEAPTGRPIYEMSDEYVERDPAGMSTELKLRSKAELARVEALLALQSPEALEAQARLELEKRGVDTSKPNTTMALLGRGAFAAVQYVAPFGLAKAGSGLSIADQASNTIL